MKNITLKILIPTLFGVLLTMGHAYAQAIPIEKSDPKFDILFAEGNEDVCVFSIEQSQLSMAIDMTQATQQAKDCGYHVRVQKHDDLGAVCGVTQEDGCLPSCDVCAIE